jgi:hypothetical protein
LHHDRHISHWRDERLYHDERDKLRRGKLPGLLRVDFLLSRLQRLYLHQ